MTLAWTAEPERGSAVALRTIGWVARRLGRPCARLLLYPITLYFFLTAARARAASGDYLRRVLVRRPRLIDRWRHFHCFACTILDRVYLLTGGAAGFDVEISDPDGLRHRTRSAGGCVLLGAHVGSFDLLRTLAVSDHGIRLKVLMRTEHNAVVTRFLEALNPAIAGTVLPVDDIDDVLRLRDCLESGHVIALLADRLLPGERSVRCEFLGAPAAFPVAPLRLAAALGAPVFLAFGAYRGGRRYDVRFELFAERLALGGARRGPAIAAIAQRFADRLALFVRDAPFNWFNFYPFWPR